MERGSRAGSTPKAKRAFEILELARKFDLSAAEAEGLYNVAEGDLKRAEELAGQTKSPGPP